MEIKGKWKQYKICKSSSQSLSYKFRIKDILLSSAVLEINYIHKEEFGVSLHHQSPICSIKGSREFSCHET